jgi:hypothetical protein
MLMYVCPYKCVCVLILMCVCPHASSAEKCALQRYYMLLYATTYVSSYKCVCVLMLMYVCPHASGENLHIAFQRTL